MLKRSDKEVKMMCDLNYVFFKANIDCLCNKYRDKFIVIKDQSVIGFYDTFDEAYNETLKKEELGTFLIQFCSNDESKIVNYFYSNNVSFV